MNISESVFGKLSTGEEVKEFELVNKNGMKVSLLNYGASISKVLIPEKDGNYTDIALGYDNVKGYEADTAYLGVTVGRYANRIANGTFTIDGTEYKLAINNGPNALHGGLVGFNKKVWDAEIVEQKIVKFTYISIDGEEGYPGNLKVSVSFELSEDNRLIISYEAVTDKATHLNLTNHSYFNLNGCESDVLNHEVKIMTDKYTPFDENSIPLGEIVSLEGSDLYIPEYTKICERIGSLGDGFDHNYVLDSNGKDCKLCASVKENGKTMEVYTTEPGLQFYTGNFLENIKGKKGKVYNKHYGLCMETEHFPNTPNQPQFPSTLLNPGETYQQKTIYKFLW